MLIMGKMLIMGEAIHLWGKEVYGKSLYLSLNFAKNFFKNKKLKRQRKNPDEL